MRPTDPRELLYPVLPAQTYRELGISPPAPPRQYGSGGPLSAAGTPFLTGSAVTGSAPAHPAILPPASTPAPPVGPLSAEPTAQYPPPTGSQFPSAPMQSRGSGNHHALWIIAGTTAVIIAIIVSATWIIVASLGPNDEDQIRTAIATETQALNDRNLNALMAIRCSADVRQLQREFTAQTFAAEIDSMIGSSGRWDVTVHSVAVDRGAGTATAQETSVPVGADSGLAQTDTVNLRKESGQWKVCVSASSPY